MKSRTRSRKTGLDRIKPLVEKADRNLAVRTQNRQLRAITGHGVVSTGAQRRIVWVSAPGDYATFNSNHTPDGTGLHHDSDRSHHRHSARTVCPGSSGASTNRTHSAERGWPGGADDPALRRPSLSRPMR